MGAACTTKRRSRSWWHCVGVSRLARECGVNANQVGRWLREHGRGGRARKAVASVVPTPSAFVAIAVPPASPIRVQGDDDNVAVMDMQARLPNGVALDLRAVQVRHVSDVIEALGRLRCFASTKT
jgi:transposase